MDSIPPLHNHDFPSVDMSIAWSTPSHSIKPNKKRNDQSRTDFAVNTTPLLCISPFIRSISQARDLIAWLPFTIFSVRRTYFLDTLKICKMDDMDGLYHTKKVSIPGRSLTDLLERNPPLAEVRDIEMLYSCTLCNSFFDFHKDMSLLFMPNYI